MPSVQDLSTLFLNLQEVFAHPFQVRFRPNGPMAGDDGLHVHLKNPVARRHPALQSPLMGQGRDIKEGNVAGEENLFLREINPRVPRRLGRTEGNYPYLQIPQVKGQIMVKGRCGRSALYFVELCGKTGHEAGKGRLQQTRAENSVPGSLVGHDLCIREKGVSSDGIDVVMGMEDPAHR